MGAQRQKFGVGSFIGLFIFGAIFTTAGLFGIKSTIIDSGWTKVSGTVVGAEPRSSSKGGTTYAAVVEYKVGNQTNQVTSGFSSSFSPNIGESKEVAYNPARPDNAKIVEGMGASWFLYIFPVVGIGCILLAIFSFIKSLKRSNAIGRLMQRGQKLQGVLVDIKTSPVVKNGVSSYRLVVAATDNLGVVQNYESDSLTGIAALGMEDFRNKPIPIDVYIDSANPKSYYVDISDIPNLTPAGILELLKKAAVGHSAV